MAFQVGAFQTNFQQVVQAEVAQRHAGRARRRRYYVEIDGQTFWAENEAHAQAILDQAAELAVKAAEKAADEIVEKRTAKGVTRPVVPVKIAVPLLETSAPIDLRPYEQAIRAAYKRAAELAELKLLLAKQMAEEDEEEALLLLM